ncbi:MAG: hypothetical protein FJZ16_10200 [Candidatus Omnitrophica bacterium]|nr:hypothetical protein [Candidatus Omnitrophota bacterium]
MARLYSNENFPLPAVEKLRQLGHDVLTMQNVGQTGQSMSDEAVLNFALDTGRILLTLNRKHFVHLHNQNKNHSGIIVCSFDPDFESLAYRIDKVISIYSNFLGQLIRINRPSGIA